MTEMEYIYFVHVYKFIRNLYEVERRFKFIVEIMWKEFYFFCCFLGEKPDVRRTLLK